MVCHITHYTRTIEGVTGILSNGFAWVPNKRNLISDLLASPQFKEREPQAFGMVSFTELEPHEATAHQKAFGQFGITVSEAWASMHRAQRVIYIDRRGPVFEALGALFRAGYEQNVAAIKYPEDAGWQMAYTNKAVANVLGADLWANLLQLYEYFEPVEHSNQREWRVVNPMPLYGLAETPSEAIKVVSPPRGWAQHTHVIPVAPADVVRLICPKSARDRLRECMPDDYRNAAVHSADG